MSPKTIILILSIVAATLLVNILWVFTPNKISPELQSILLPEPKPLQTFTLIDQHKQAFNLERLQGQWTFLFFGYTSCPDICPPAMMVLKTVYEHFKQQAQIFSNIQVVFVSVDPQRDKPEQLFDYVAYFNPEFLGVTGMTEEIDNLARQLGGGYIKEQTDNVDEYQFAHTSTFFLIDPQKRLYAKFSQPHIAKTIIRQYIQIRTLD